MAINQILLLGLAALVTFTVPSDGEKDPKRLATSHLDNLEFGIYLTLGQIAAAYNSEPAGRLVEKWRKEGKFNVTDKAPAEGAWVKAAREVRASILAHNLGGIRKPTDSHVGDIGHDNATAILSLKESLAMILDAYVETAEKREKLPTRSKKSTTSTGTSMDLGNDDLDLD